MQYLLLNYETERSNSKQTRDNNFLLLKKLKLSNTICKFKRANNSGKRHKVIEFPLWKALRVTKTALYHGMSFAVSSELWPVTFDFNNRSHASLNNRPYANSTIGRAIMLLIDRV